MAKRDRGKALARERARRAVGVPDEKPAATSREAARTCGSCGSPLVVLSVGRIPKWCSQTCRQRAWEVRRAAVEIVERIVHVPVEVPGDPRSSDWPVLLQQLATQLNAGRIPTRDLPAVRQNLDAVVVAYTRASTRR